VAATSLNSLPRVINHDISPISLALPSKPPDPVEFISDSGASKTFVTPQDQHILQNCTLDTDPVIITTASNDAILTSQARGLLPVQQLPLAARDALVVPGLSHNLLSTGTLCQADCVVTYSKDDVIVTHPSSATPLLTGKYCRDTEQYVINVPPTSDLPQSTNTVPLL
jgi:hypothetical protein